MDFEQEYQLQEALDNLFKSAEYRKVCKLTQELAGTKLNCPSIERAIDENLICRGAWIYDTINGPEKGRKKTLVAKIRKILGYAYP